MTIAPALTVATSGVCVMTGGVVSAGAVTLKVWLDVGAFAGVVEAFAAGAASTARR